MFTRTAVGDTVVTPEKLGPGNSVGARVASSVDDPDGDATDADKGLGV